MKKRSHKNTTRLTAGERAKELVDAFLADGSASYDDQVRAAKRQFQAHARQTRRRNDARARARAAVSMGEYRRGA